MADFMRLDKLSRIMLLLTLLWLQLQVTLVDSQNTVTIPTSSLSPNIGTTNYQLQCNINNYHHQAGRAFAWLKDGKDGEVISWNNEIQDGFDPGIFEARETQRGGTILYFLTILQVLATHGGIYRCVVADGLPSAYAEVNYAQVEVKIPYFPPEGNPMCSPAGSSQVAAGRSLLLSCTSLPGYPEEDQVNILLQKDLAVLSSSSQIVNGMKRIDYNYDVTSLDNGQTFTCIITGNGQYTGMTRSCTIGPLEVVSDLPVITPVLLTRSVGENAIFTCTFSVPGTIEWYTVPATSSGFTTGSVSGGMTFTLTNLQPEDNNKVIVCKATIGGTEVDARATLTVTTPDVPTTKKVTTMPTTTTKQPITRKVTNPPNVPDPTTKTSPPQSPPTDDNSVPKTTKTPQPPGTATTKKDGELTFAPAQEQDVIIIAIAAVGGLVFILIVVIIVACICCYNRRPKPVVIADDDDQDSFDSEASWEARADGAMTRKSRVIYRNADDITDDPPPRRPENNRGFAEDLAPNLLKIPDGLSTISGSTMTPSMSPSLQYAMKYLNSPEDPLRDDHSVAHLNDSRDRLSSDDRYLYSQGTTEFGGPPTFDPTPPGMQNYDLPPDEMNESGTFVKRMPTYDAVPPELLREQEPDMPTYALPHRDRKVQNVVYNPNSQNVPDIQIHDLNRKRQSSIPYVNTAFGYDDHGGMVPNAIYHSSGEGDMQYY